MEVGLQPSAWHDLFVAAATTFAALLGLFFVAMSFHLEEVEELPVLRHRSRITSTAMVAALVQSLCVLIPVQGPRLLGAELGGIFVIYLASTIRLTIAAQGSFKAVHWVRFVLPNAFALLELVAAGSLVLEKGPGLFLFAPVILVGIPVCALNAWNVLFAPELRELRRTRSARARH